MTRMKLKSLLSAGVFSAALLSGAAYADETPAKKEAVSKNDIDVSTPTAKDASDDKEAKPKKAESKGKGFLQHGCAGAGGCAGDK